MKKILLLGSNGMLGNTIYNKLNLSDQFFVFSVDKLDNIYLQQNYRQLDLVEFEKFKKYLEEIQPDVIINAVAIVNLNTCENNKALVNKIHVELNKIINEYTVKMNKRAIYISTDSVFDGIKGNYREFDETNPLNYYAKTKLEGEKEILKNKNSLVLRTNIYGYSKNQESFFKWGYTSLINNIEVTGYMDVYFNPVSVNQLSEFITEILTLQKANGIINICSKEKISKYEFLEKIAKLLNKENYLKKGYLGNQENSIVKRPKDTSLNTELLEKKYKKKYFINEGILEIMDVIKNV